MMRRTSRLALLLAAAASAALFAFAPAAAGKGGVAVDVDLRSADGARVAALFGSVGANGRGFGTIVPLSSAGAVGMRRPESVRVLRLADGSLQVGGGLGTAIRVRLDGGRGAQASGRLSVALDAARTVAVHGAGVASRRPYRPRPGHVVVVVGRPSGALKVALERRYRLVRYRADRWSRSALLANPARLDGLAGFLVGPEVRLSRLRNVDALRSFYNSGRWVGVTGSPRSLDPHMYVVAHAHLGKGGALVRHPTSNLGEASRNYLQIREPRIARVRIGPARMGRDTLPKATIMAAIRQGTDRVQRALVQGERASGSRVTSIGASDTPATVNPSIQGLAWYSVPISQTIMVTMTTTSAPWLSMQGWLCSTPQNYGGLFFSPPNCPPQTQTQTVALDFAPVYTVSLATSPDQVQTQTVAEVSSTSVNAGGAANPQLVAGEYSDEMDVVLPQQWPNPTLTTFNYYNDIVLTPGASSLQESGLLFAMGYHSVVLDCSQACTPTAGSAPPQMKNLAGPTGSTPSQQVTQVGADWSSGTGWEDSQSATSGWDISGNLGFFGSDPTAGLEGGYNSSVTTETSQSGNLSTSISYTLSNWTSNGVQGSGPSPGTLQGTYTSFSQQIPNAGGEAASAASSYDFTPFLPTSATQLVTATNGLIALPSAYGGNGPGPLCTWQTCNVGAAPAAWGSGMNVVDYQQGSTTVGQLGNGQSGALVVGSVDTAVADSFYFVDQWQWSGWPTSVINTYFGPGVAAFAQILVLDQTDVQAAGTPYSPPTSVAAQPTTTTPVGGTTTYYNQQGQVQNGAAGSAYSTVGLDLCAPPVLTDELWTAGCDQDPSLTGSSTPPATVAGEGPAITVNGVTPTVSNGQQTAAAGSTLQCQTGQWSGSPTYAYQWQQWAAQEQVWVPLSGQTAATFQAPTSGPGYFLCQVTATNAGGSAQAASASVLTGATP